MPVLLFCRRLRRGRARRQNGARTLHAPRHGSARLALRAIDAEVAVHEISAMLLGGYVQDASQLPSAWPIYSQAQSAGCRYVTEPEG